MAAGGPLNRLSDLRTGRLLLRRPRLGNAAALFAFVGNAEAMRLTNADASLRHTRRRIALRGRARGRDGFAPWTPVTWETGRIIGWGGIHADPFDPGSGPEVAYLFHPDAWGQGFASELVAACTALADGPLALPQLRGFAHPGDAASRRVMEKAGFVEERFVPKINRWVFRRPRWGGGPAR